MKHEVNAKSIVESDLVKDFHNKRLLFIIIANKIFAEKEPSGLSHYEWIKTLDFKDVIVPYNSLDVIKDNDFIMNNFTRGYFYNNKLVLYTGMDFRVDTLCIDNLRYCLKLLIEAFNLNDDTKIGIGCIPVKDSIFEVKYDLDNLINIKNRKDFTDLYKLVEK